MSSIRVVVLTQCAASKVDHPAPAEQLYTGQHHVRLMRGVNALRGVESATVDLHIVSAGHGIVHGDTILSPYDSTFVGVPETVIRQRGHQLGIPQALRAILVSPYDLAVVALGKAYLTACWLHLPCPVGGPTVVLTAADTVIPPRWQRWVLATPHTRAFRCGQVGLKGEVAARVLHWVASKPVADLLASRSPLDLLASAPR